jgi:ribosomal protein S12 methylthiotransferase accessory factor
MRLQHRLPSKPQETLRKAVRLVDEEAGVIKLLFEAPISPDGPKIFGCGSQCNEYSHIGSPSERSISGSTSLARDQAIAGAIGEAAERYSAAFIPYENVISSSYSSLDGDSLLPSSLTLYEKEQYGHSNFPYQPVGSDDVIGWVAGHSLGRDRAVLVPAFAVYQPYRSLVGEAPVIQQITTGLACGNTLEEAVLSALCEVVERDASMLMWLQSRQPPRVVASRSTSSLVSLTLDRFGSLDRYVTLLDVTTDLNIPAYVAVWDGPIEKERGAIFASCANLSPDRAASGALLELAQCLMWATSLIDAREHIPDPLVDTLSRIEDHVLWPLRSSSRTVFEFLLSSAENVDIAQRQDASSEDVLKSIQTCVELISARGLDVVVVDVTSPDIAECGLHVVRALIPGTQPLFFGTGLHRLSARANSNPYPSRARTGINLLPHPFP